MANTDLRGDKPAELYHRYVGEPESRRDIYGYWLFLAGSLAGILGIGLFQFEQAVDPGNLEIRQVAIVLAAIGLVIALFGIVVLLPVRRRGMHVSLVGLLVAFVAIGLFTWAYPHSWYVEPDYSPEIIGLYAIGISIIGAVAVLVPVVTGERGLLVEPELGLGSDEPPVLLGKTDRDAFFTIYQTPTKDWTWRVLSREAVGESLSLSRSDTDARLHIENVKEKIGGAGLLEITTAAFRLYRTEDGEWQWSLARDNGTVVATNEETYTDRDSVETATNFCKEQIPTANVIEIRGAAFDVYEDDAEQWHWRMVDDARRPLAESPAAFQGETDAEGATERFVEYVDDARVLPVQSVAIELLEEDDAWQWRLLDATDSVLATSETRFETRRQAEVEASDVADSVADASVLEHGTPGYEVTRVGESWTWRLRSATDDIVATSAERAPGETDATRAAERTREVVGDAETVEFSGADYEVYRAGEGWHWRLVTEDRNVLAESTEAFADRETARNVADRVHEQAQVADLIEFEQAAFQQYESDGEWRWRLIDEDGRVMADSGEEYGSKEAVREGMTTLKEHAPNAAVLEIETAAFELYLTENESYTWRLIDEGGALIAESATDHETRRQARDSVEYLLEHVGGADVREMGSAIFQFVSVGDEWAYRLIHPDGTILAEPREPYQTRDDMTDAIETVRMAGSKGEVQTVWPLAFKLFTEGGVHWRLVDGDREVLATGERTYESPEDARTEFETIAAMASSAPLFTHDRGVIWISQDGEGHANGTDGSGDDDDAIDGASSWHWRLQDPDREAIAHGPGTFETLEDAQAAVESVRTLAGDAGRFEIDTAAFERYRGEEGWGWRLVDEEETTYATSSTQYPSREEVDENIAEVREIVTAASILEIDEAAFEFHERDGGWIWRLVDEHGDPIAESVASHETRGSAREEMLLVKNEAPEGELRIAY